MRIIHPHPAQGSQKFIGVDFVDGVAVAEALHPETVAALVQHGYKIEHDVEAVTLESLTLAELRDVADTEGIDYPKSAGKQKLIGLIDSAPVRTITDGGIVDGGQIISNGPDHTETVIPLAVPNIVQLNAAGRKLLGDTEMTAEVQEISPDLITVLWEDGKASDITPSLIELVRD